MTDKAEECCGCGGCTEPLDTTPRIVQGSIGAITLDKIRWDALTDLAKQSPSQVDDA